MKIYIDADRKKEIEDRIAYCIERVSNSSNPKIGACFLQEKIALEQILSESILIEEVGIDDLSKKHDRDLRSFEQILKDGNFKLIKTI